MDVDSILYNTKWRIGNKSLFGFYDDYFVKLLPIEPPIHKFLINNFNSEITSCTPRFEEFYRVKFEKDGDTYKYLYLFESVKADIVKIPKYFKEGLLEGDVKKILSGLIYVFNKLNKNGFAFHDVCWDNICWNTKKNEVCIIDMDSVVKTSAKYEAVKDVGSLMFYTVFLRAKEDYQLNNLEFLDVCIITNIFISFAVGLYYEDMAATFMRGKSEENVKKFITDVFDGATVGYDAKICSILKCSIYVLSKCIKNKDIDMIRGLLKVPVDKGICPLISEAVEAIERLRDYINNEKSAAHEIDEATAALMDVKISVKNNKFEAAINKINESIKRIENLRNITNYQS